MGGAEEGRGRAGPRSGGGAEGWAGRGGAEGGGGEPQLAPAPVNLCWVVRIISPTSLVLAFSLGPPSGQWVGIGEVTRGPPPCRAVYG